MGRFFLLERAIPTEFRMAHFLTLFEKLFPSNFTLVFGSEFTKEYNWKIYYPQVFVNKIYSY